VHLLVLSIYGGPSAFPYVSVVLYGIDALLWLPACILMNM